MKWNKEKINRYLIYVYFKIPHIMRNFNTTHKIEIYGSAVCAAYENDKFKNKENVH